LHRGKPPLTNFLVLNSLAFFEKEKIRMEGHAQVHLYLDRDLARIKCTRESLKNSVKFVDKSHSYRSCKDLNDWLMKRKRPEHKVGHGIEDTFNFLVASYVLVIPKLKNSSAGGGFERFVSH